MSAPNPDDPLDEVKGGWEGISLASEAERSEPCRSRGL